MNTRIASSLTLVAALVATGALLVSACGKSPEGCAVDADCAAGQTCETATGECRTSLTPPGGTDAGKKEGATPLECYDGVDNDSDGLLDCADPDCAGITCRQSAGACDLAETCTGGVCPADEHLAPGAACGTPSCTGTVFADRGTCDAQGSCDLPTQTDCFPYACTPDGCTTSCTGPAECGAGGTCISGLCVSGTDLPQGSVCALDSQCSTGFCVDGFCCDGACDGACESCNATGSEGTCGNAPGGAEGDPSCAPYVCAGGPGCPTTCANDDGCTGDFWCSSNTCIGKKSQGLSCGGDNECSSGFCVDGVCCDSACDGLCAACNLAGALGTCTSRPVDTDPQNECGAYTCDGAGACQTSCSGGVCGQACKSGFWCNGTSCTQDKPNGSGCTEPCECQSGACTNFFQDSDGDGYGNPAVQAEFCGTSPPTGFVTNSADCCDTDARARPGQATYYSTPRNGCGGFDFNCDGTSQRQHTTPSSCPSSSSPCGTTICIGAQGWGGAVPPCGSTGVWRICQSVSCATFLNQCQVTHVSMAQSCR